MWKLIQHKWMQWGLAANVGGMLLVCGLYALEWIKTDLPITDAEDSFHEKPTISPTNPLNFSKSNNSSSPDPEIVPRSTETAFTPAPETDEAISARLYSALYSVNSQDRLGALDSIWESVETFSMADKILRRIEELSADTNVEVSELAQLVGLHMQEVRGIHEANTIQSPEDRYPAQPMLANAALDPAPAGKESEHFSGNEMSFSVEENHAEGEQENFTQLRKRALNDPDASERAQALEEALVQRDERIIDLLSHALRDPDAVNRRMAMSGLQQFLEEGFGDPQDIVRIHAETRTE